MPPKDAVIDAINQMFAEFELVYHNQYLKAFPSAEKLAYAKKLWFSNLREFAPERILAAAHTAIRESEFLPSIASILKHCEVSDSELGLPDAHSAYLEACRAQSPKAEYCWSHPAVYYAGREAGWFFLANNTENVAFPVFRRHYEAIRERVLRGGELEPIDVKALPEDTSTPLTVEQRREKMRRLRKDTGL